VIGVRHRDRRPPTRAEHSFDRPFPMPFDAARSGKKKYGLTRCGNLARLAVTGAVVIEGPLPIVAVLDTRAARLALSSVPEHAVAEAFAAGWPGSG